jgi:Predicted transcriptional regulator
MNQTFTAKQLFLAWLTITSLAAYFGGTSWAIGIGILFFLAILQILWEERKKPTEKSAPTHFYTSSSQNPNIYKAKKSDSLRGTQNPPSEKRVYDTVRFKYRDANGEITDRTVDITTGKKGDIFKGYCHLRKASRTFYFNRIHDFEVIHAETGEVTTPMEWRYKLQKTKVAKEALIEERRTIESLKNKTEANNTWLSLTTPAPTVEFNNKNFALAGRFSSGNRDDCETKTENKSGVIQATPNGKTNYIVVNPSAGVNQTFEKAIKKLLERGIQPVIISEDHWLFSLENS